MRIRGLTFAGSATEHRNEMTVFLRESLGLTQVYVEGIEADVFGLEDGSQFAVSAPGGMGPSARAIGFLVDDLDDALLTLGQHGHWTGTPAENATSRYAHFYAPDGHLYELVERKDDAAGAGPNPNQPDLT